MITFGFVTQIYFLHQSVMHVQLDGAAADTTDSGMCLCWHALSLPLALLQPALQGQEGIVLISSWPHAAWPLTSSSSPSFCSTHQLLRPLSDCLCLCVSRVFGALGSGFYWRLLHNSMRPDGSSCLRQQTPYLIVVPLFQKIKIKYELKL